MEFTLVTVRPFGAHRKGDVISDPSEIATILAGEDAHNVVRVAAPSAAAPAPPATAGNSSGGR
jgi:hypothetical protein